MSLALVPSCSTRIALLTLMRWSSSRESTVGSDISDRTCVSSITGNGATRVNTRVAPNKPRRSTGTIWGKSRLSIRSTTSVSASSEASRAARKLGDSGGCAGGSAASVCRTPAAVRADCAADADALANQAGTAWADDCTPLVPLPAPPPPLPLPLPHPLLVASTPLALSALASHRRGCLDGRCVAALATATMPRSEAAASATASRPLRFLRRDDSMRSRGRCASCR